jgi:signal transduction histidine kinase
MPPQPPTARVLLVDDKPQNLVALEATLSNLQLDVVKAGSGEEALRYLLKDDFAVILLDVRMPGMDGLQTAGLIRGRERSRDTPIIFITAWGSDDDLVTRGYSLGAVDYIVKPIHPHILRSKVAVFVELFRTTAQVRQQAAQLAGLNEELEARVTARTAELQRTVKDLRQQIAERKRAEAERAQLLVREQAARCEAERAVRIRDDFLAMAGHELRTPLTSLHGAIELLRATRQGTLDASTPDRVQRILKIIEKQDEQLIKLVNNLLDVSRLSEGRLELELEEVDLSAIVYDVVECFREEIARARCRLDIHAQPHVVGVWDRSRLEQVVTNLLMNALKYGAGTEVTVCVSADTTSARLAVADQGIGIAPQHLERIFGRFERAVAGKEYSGVGLGLSIAHDIVEALGGTIGVVSEPGRGATFTVELPLPLRAMALPAPPQGAGRV